MPIGFAAIDWWIVLVYMVIATAPGFLCRKYIRAQEDFLIAGRTLSVFLATATLTATETGLITVMYMAEFGYANGFAGMVIGVISVITTLFIGLSGFMVAGLRRSGATTIAEYYQLRYSRGVRIIGGMIIATAGILNYGIFLQIEADFIRLLTHIPDVQITPLAPGAAPIFISSIKLVMFVLVVLVLSYTLLGGMVSVVVTDYVQFIFMSAGIFGATWWVLYHSGIGGFHGMVDAVQRYRPEYGFNPFKTVPGGSGAVLGIGAAFVVWQLMHWTGMNTWQTAAFRTAATDSPSTTRKMWALTAFNYFGRAVIPMIWGVGALAWLAQTKTPAEIAAIPNRQGMPLFLAQLPTGLVGILMAGMLAALMSTHSSYLLAWSGVLTEDIVAPLARIAGWEIPPAWRMRITRTFIILLGIFLVTFGLWFKVKETIWGYLSVTGTIYVAGSAALVVMGLYWRRASTRGAYLGLLGGALPGIVYLALRMGTLVVEPEVSQPGHVPQSAIARMSAQMTDARTGISSFPLGFAGMIVGSLWSPRRPEDESEPVRPDLTEAAA